MKLVMPTGTVLEETHALTVPQPAPSIKPASYITSAVINTGLCVWLKPYQGGLQGLITLVIMYLIQGYSTLKKKEYKKFLDLTIRYGLTISIFYLIPKTLMFFGLGL